MRIDRRNGKRYPECKTCSSLCCKYPWVTVHFSPVEYEAWLDDSLPWETIAVTEHDVRFVDPEMEPTKYSKPRIEPILAKNENGSCLYFQRNKCTLYKKQRPWNCRAWFCGKGTDEPRVYEILSGWEEDLDAQQ